MMIDVRDMPGKNKRTKKCHRVTKKLADFLCDGTAADYRSDNGFLK